MVRCLLTCLIYMGVLGLLCFPFGRVLSRLPLTADGFPFRCYVWERNGKIYNKLRVRSWQNVVPDVSRMFPGTIPKKEVGVQPDENVLQTALKETCVAELTHWILCIAGLVFLWLWPGVGGVCCWLVYVLLGNLPFIVIQRYNRPRLQRAISVTKQRERRMIHACTDPQFE